MTTAGGAESVMSVDSFSNVVVDQLLVVVVAVDVLNEAADTAAAILEGSHARTIVALNKARGTNDSLDRWVVVHFIVPR